MKKTYKKPMMIVERFTLSQTIATGCGENLEGWGEPLHATKAVCAWDSNGFHMFQEASICENASEIWEFICYNAPEGSYNIFHS